MNRENKLVALDKEARDGILEGARKVYELVKQAYGPQSGNVAIEKNWGKPILTHDGVTIAREVFLTDSVENIGAQLLVEASKKTNDLAGDGTSATVILGYHIIKKARERVALGFNAMGIRRGILKASKMVSEAIVNMSQEVVGTHQLKEIAVISSGDKEVGELIANTILEVGEHGGTTVEEYQGTDLESEIVEGLYYDKGFHSPMMATDGNTASYDKPLILVTEKKISSNNDIVPILKAVADKDNLNKRLLIIGDVAGEALNTLIINKLKGIVSSVSAPAPLHGNQRGLALEDIAILTGAKMFWNGDNFDSITLDDFGTAKKVVIDSASTTIIEGSGDKDKVSERIDKLKETIKHPDKANFAVEIYEDRLARLVGKIGVIRVGGATETEARELKDRVDDAVGATLAAREEGVVPGGGICLLNISDMDYVIDNQDEKIGVEVVLEALKEPFTQLMENSGRNAEFYLMKLSEAEPGWGFDVKGNDLIDMKMAGIIDPTKVVRLAVENACSIAAQAITTNATITFDKDNQPKAE